jgi:predicted DNA-binding transcriptional regulator AlpA
MSTPAVVQVAQSNEQLVTAKEVATRIGLSVGWVNDHASGRRRPILPSVKLGKAVRFRPSDITRLIEECARNAT